MIEKKTVIERIEILSNGSFQVRFAKLIVDDDKIVGAPQWHRTAFDPGTELDPLLAAVNDHLEQMGEARVIENETSFSKLTPQFLREKVLIIHTPELIQQYKTARDAALAAMQPKPAPTLLQKIVNVFTP